MYRVTLVILFLAMAAFLSSCDHAQDQLAFQHSIPETLKIASDGGYWMAPQEARHWQNQQDKAYRFIDIRPAIHFDRGSLNGAINIPLPNLLGPKARELFADPHTTTVLFGETEADAHGAWLLLRQMGYSNVLLLQGGYAFQQLPDSVRYIPSEQIRYDYSALMTEAIQRYKKEEEATRPKAVPQPIVKAPKQIIPQKKPKPVVKEEEGC